MNHVNAQTYYSSYGPYTEYQDEKVETSDIRAVESANVCNWYKLDYSYNFFIEDKNTEDFPDKTGNTTIVNTDWDKIIPPLEPNRIILENTIYTYRKMNKIRYIQIDNIKNIGEIAQIYFYVDSKIKTFDFYCDNCAEQTAKNVSNGNPTIAGNYVYDGANIVIDLKEYYDIMDIELRFKIYSEEMNEKSMRLRYVEDDVVYYEYNIKETFNTPNRNNIRTHIMNYNVMNKINPEYGDEKETNNQNDIKFTDIITKITTYYHTIDKLFEYYRVDKIYSNTYSISNEEYPYCDPEDKKIVYRYRERGKVVISDDLYFTDKSRKIEDLILETNVDITITSNIDYAVNGKYKVNFITPFKVITVDVVVDIKENILNALITQVEINNELKREYNILASSINRQEENIKEILSNNKKTIDQLNNDLFKEKNINQELKKQKTLDKSGETLTSRKQIFIPIAFIIIFIISLYYTFKKNVDEKI